MKTVVVDTQVQVDSSDHFTFSIPAMKESDFREDEIRHYNKFKKHTYKEVKKRNSFFRRKG